MVLTGISDILIRKIPTVAISRFLNEAIPQNLPELERKRIILVNDEQIYLDKCDQSLEYLFTVLKDITIPFKEKEKVARSILTNYLNLKIENGRRTFVLCLLLILYLLSIHNTSGYYIILKNLIKSIKEKRISKAVGRLIIRRLKNRGLIVDPELLEIVNS
jgi:hypothetical protein